MDQQPAFEALFRASPYPYLVLDLKLNIIGANAAYLRATGRAESDIMGRYVFDAFLKIPTIPTRPIWTSCVAR